MGEVVDASGASAAGRLPAPAPSLPKPRGAVYSAAVLAPIVAAQLLWFGILAYFAVRLVA
jgi:hypothetical protein